MIQFQLAGPSEHQRLTEALEIISGCAKSMEPRDFETFVFMTGSFIIRKITKPVYLKYYTQPAITQLCYLLSENAFAIKVLPYLAEYSIEKQQHTDHLARLFVNFAKTKCSRNTATQLVRMLADYRMERFQIEQILELIKHDSDLVDAFKGFVPRDDMDLLAQQ